MSLAKKWALMAVINLWVWYFIYLILRFLWTS